MAISIKTVVSVAVALVILFVMTTTMVMPYFRNAWQFCQARTWKPAVAGVYTTNCTNAVRHMNTSEVTGTTHTEEGETWPTSGTFPVVEQWCLDCTTLGGYRTTNQGLILLIFVIGLIGFAVYFLKYR